MGTNRDMGLVSGTPHPTGSTSKPRAWLHSSHLRVGRVTRGSLHRDHGRKSVGRQSLPTALGECARPLKQSYGR